MTSLERKDRDELRCRYREDMLYKAWSHTLNELHLEMNQPYPEELWYETERMHKQLRPLGEDAEYEIDSIFSNLIDDLEGEDCSRGEAVFTAVAVTVLLLSQLEAAKPKKGKNPNEGCCKSLAKILTKKDFVPVTMALMRMLAESKTNNSGKKLVVPVMNYLDEVDTAGMLSATTRQKIENQVKLIEEKTRGIKRMLRITPEQYHDMWTEILSDNEMLVTSFSVEPRKNEWEMNMKMICNVIGIMQLHHKTEDNASHLAAGLGLGKTRNYIRMHADRGGNSVFSKEQHAWVEKIVQKYQAVKS